MATDSVGAVSKPGKIKKEFIDQLIVNVDETRITEEQEEAWAKMLKDGSRVPCPHKVQPKIPYMVLSVVLLLIMSCFRLISQNYNFGVFLTFFLCGTIGKERFLPRLAKCYVHLLPLFDT